MKLYVGNLNFNTTNEDLTKLFTGIGPVASVNIIHDAMTGRSRGFGFVEMQNESDGQTLIEQFNGKEIAGRTVKVNEATPKTRGGNTNRVGGYGSGYGDGYGRSRNDYGGRSW